MAEPDPKSMLLEVFRQVPEGEDDLGDMQYWLPALTEFVREFAAPGFECVMQGLPPTPPTRHPGVNGLAEGWADYAETFESVRVELDDIRESDDGVVILVNQVAKTRTGGVELRQPSAMVFAFEDGQVGRVEFHLDREAALRSTGIEPGA